MRVNKTDKIFHKLGDYGKSPTPMAWDKVQQQLSENKRTYWWPKIAVMLLICLSSLVAINHVKKGFFYSKEELSGNSFPDENTLATKNPKTTKSVETWGNEEDHVPKSKPSEALLAENQMPPKPLNRKNVPQIVPAIDKMENRSARELESELPSKLEEYPLHNSAILAENRIPQEKEAKKKSFSITIEYKSGSTNENLIAERKLEKEAEPENQPFNLKHIFEKVKDVKEGEVGLADLRQAKDEILAFDFTRLKHIKDSKQ